MAESQDKQHRETCHAGVGAVSIRSHGGHPTQRRRIPSTSASGLSGGESGHGLKHGPPMAERLAAAFASGTTLPADFALGERSGSQSLRTASSSHAS
jgi:hypothetical protein